jgi:hypothetical protein
MAAAILLHADAVIFKDPTAKNARKAHTHRWWAEGGLIHWEDLDAGPTEQRFGSQTVVETLQRLKGINDMIGNNRTGKGWNYPDEMQAFRSYIDGMINVCKRAKEQGMPDDPVHAKQLVAEVKERRKSRMVIPGLATGHW